MPQKQLIGHESGAEAGIPESRPFRVVVDRYLIMARHVRRSPQWSNPSHGQRHEASDFLSVKAIGGVAISMNPGLQLVWDISLGR